jgi:integrase
MPRSSAFVLATEREVHSAKPKGDRAEFRIKGAQNLVLRITPAEAKTWTFLYTSPLSGKRCKLSLGPYPAKGLADARNEALALTLAVKEGKDPLAQKRARATAETFEQLAREYMREHERKYAKGGWRSGWTNEVWRLLNADILPMIGDYRAEALTKWHVRNVVETVAERGAYVTADHVLGLIRAIYNWAAGTGRLEVNPTFGMKKRNAGRPRHRILSDHEIRTLWRTLDAGSGLSSEIRDALKLQLLLGLRRSEVLEASRSEVHLEYGIWTIPAERTKSRREHALPLPALAVSILTSAIGRNGKSPWLFPSPVAANAAVRPRSASRALLRMRDDIGLVGVGTHDLRRTLATGLGNMGVAEEVIERVLNHAPRTVAGRHYNHAKYFGPMRQALEAWAEVVRNIVEDRSPASEVAWLRSVGGQ